MLSAAFNIVFLPTPGNDTHVAKLAVKLLEDFIRSPRSTLVLHEL
jgi:hypothetical protein